MLAPYVPDRTDDPTIIVTVAFDIADDGETDAIMSPGKPLTSNDTGSANPPLRNIDITTLTLPPRGTIDEVGDASKVKLPAPPEPIMTSTVALCGSIPVPLARTVTGLDPELAPAAAVNVSVLDVAPLSRVDGEIVALTPAGTFTIDNVI